MFGQLGYDVRQTLRGLLPDRALHWERVLVLPPTDSCSVLSQSQVLAKCSRMAVPCRYVESPSQAPATWSRCS
jgi:hypothetical protein